MSYSKSDEKRRYAAVTLGRIDQMIGRAKNVEEEEPLLEALDAMEKYYELVRGSAADWRTLLAGRRRMYDDARERLAARKGP